LSLPDEHGWMLGKANGAVASASHFQRCRGRPLRVSHLVFATLCEEVYQPL